MEPVRKTGDSVARAMEAIDNLKCPLDSNPLTLEYHGDGALYSCAGLPTHTWPVKRVYTEYDTNYTEVELSEDAIAERLDEFTA